MCSMSVLCPLCSQASFASIDALRVCLIKAANGPLPCPICQELFLGLDKLTIHLFSHTSIMTMEQPPPATAPATACATSELNGANALPSETQANVSAAATAPSSKERKQRKAKMSKACARKEISEQQPLLAANASVGGDGGGDGSGADAAPLAACDICEFTFRNEQLRDMHFRLVHQNVSATASAVTPSPAYHQNAAIEPEFKCHLCAKTFKMKGSLRVHLKVVHLMGLPYVSNTPKLSICDRIRHKEARATPAAQQILLTQPTGAAAGGASFAIGTLTLLPGLAACDAGNAAAAVGGELLKANASSTDVRGSNLLLVFNANTAPMPTAPALDSAAANETAGLIDPNPKIWACNVCAKAFTTKYFLKKHKRLHTGEMPYTCEICARTFTFQQSYHKHLLYHSDEKPHVCAICGRAFKELSTLHNHERIHSGEKPFKCEVCGKCFRQRVSFLVHTRIHTGVMPYKCELCQRSFRYKVSQRTHKCATHADAPLAEDAHHAADQMSQQFIQAFLESSAVSQQHSPASAEIASINGSRSCELDEALLSKTIDDIVVESCNKMGIGQADAVGGLHAIAHSPLLDGSNSPSAKLQNMRLYSPQLLADIEGTDSAAFPHFLLDDDQNANNHIL